MPFSEPQRRVLVALIDRIIPADEYPGASENGVMVYLEKMFDGALRSNVSELLGVLSALEQQRFVELASEQQDGILQNLLSDARTGAVFDLLVSLTNEGYYGDPSNGSNLQGVSWKMIGFDPRLPEPVAEEWIKQLRTRRE